MAPLKMGVAGKVRCPGARPSALVQQGFELEGASCPFQGDQLTAPAAAFQRARWQAVRHLPASVPELLHGLSSGGKSSQSITTSQANATQSGEVDTMIQLKVRAGDVC